jgi:hypothetical protein
MVVVGAVSLHFEPILPNICSTPPVSTLSLDFTEHLFTVVR